ncbi:MAG TPA: AAA family ATPase [Methanospirillum sp.]|nr:AAA family ATPase [Methanospirillum sp.]
MTSVCTLPSWTRHLRKYLPVIPQYLLSGNVYDVYPLEISGSITTLRLPDYIRAVLISEGYGIVLQYEPLIGFTLLHGEADIIQKISGEQITAEKPLKVPPRKAAEIIGKVVSNRISYTAILINFASRLAAGAEDELSEFYYQMFRQCQIAEPRLITGSSHPRYNPIIWILDTEKDIPGWYTSSNARVRSIILPQPDCGVRRVIISALVRNISGFADLSEGDRERQISTLVDATQALYLSEIISIVSLAKRDDIPLHEMKGAVVQYQTGATENRWLNPGIPGIGEAESFLGERIKGQTRAVRTVSDILKRSVLGLSGPYTHQNVERPRGVIVLGGPSGVGKTGLVMATAELVCGSVTGAVRFDMQAFRGASAVHQLIGDGRPGESETHSQLTGAVLQNPFSVIILDEIEKASAEVLDLLIQILTRGYLISGKGERVGFSETLIFCTCNTDTVLLPHEGQISESKAKERIAAAIREIFAVQKGRPELFTLIFDNLIILESISDQAATEIFEGMLSGIISNLYNTQKISVQIGVDVRARLQQICCADLTRGGTGIGSALERSFADPLARAICTRGVSPGEVLIVRNISEQDGGWEVSLSGVSDLHE